jgi:ribonuclease R
VISEARGPALGEGDRFLARLTPIHEEDGLRYEARPMRKLQGGPKRALGVFRVTDGGGRLLPVEKGADELRVEPHDTGGAEDGELVEASWSARRGWACAAPASSSGSATPARRARCR